MCNASQFQKNNLWLFLDECQNFDPKGALPQMISESRKMGVNLILATQVLPVVTRNAVWERVMQCGTKLYFKPSEDCLVRTAKLIGNSNHQPWIKVLRELKVGEFVADGGLSSGASKINYPIRLHNREPVGFSDTMK
jgi:hypothetical protein